MTTRPHDLRPPQAELMARSTGSRALRSARAWLIGVAALLAVLAGYRHFNSRQGSDQHAASTGAPVRVAAAARRDMAMVEQSLGTVVASTLVQIVPRVSGTLERQAFREGQFVQKGALLFEIDPKPFQAALSQAQAIYRRDAAQLSNALRDKQRFETLYAQDSTSAQSRDTAGTNAEVLAATVAADKAAVDAARLNLGYTQIRSPVTGKTGPVLIQPGNMVTGGSSAGAALVTIAEVRPVKVSFTLPQSELPRIQARQRTGQLTATVEVRGAAGDNLTAPVTFTSNAINPQSGTIELRAVFANQELTLVPGELVHVIVKLDDIPNALVVPRNAVNDSPSGPFVFVVSKKTAERKPVAVVFDDGAQAAITGDLNAGDQVITEGQLRVTPGGKVHVLPRAEDAAGRTQDKAQGA